MAEKEDKDLRRLVDVLADEWWIIMSRLLNESCEPNAIVLVKAIEEYERRKSD